MLSAAAASAFNKAISRSKVMLKKERERVRESSVKVTTVAQSTTSPAFR